MKNELNWHLVNMDATDLHFCEWKEEVWLPIWVENDLAEQRQLWFIYSGYHGKFWAVKDVDGRTLALQGVWMDIILSSSLFKEKESEIMAFIEALTDKMSAITVKIEKCRTTVESNGEKIIWVKYEVNGKYGQAELARDDEGRFAVRKNTAFNPYLGHTRKIHKELLEQTKLYALLEG